MYQGTTPSYALEIAGYDLTEAGVYVTLDGANKQFTLSGDRLTVTYDSTSDKTTIVFSFSQAETFQLPVGTLKCQARWVDENDEALHRAVLVRHLVVKLAGIAVSAADRLHHFRKRLAVPLRLRHLAQNPDRRQHPGIAPVKLAEVVMPGQFSAADRPVLP